MINRQAHALLFAALFMFISRVAVADKILMDDFTVNPQSRWTFISDQVMGGVSTGHINFKADSGQSYVEMLGRVSTENNGGFIQFRSTIPELDLQGTSGIVLTVKGNQQRYFVHLRSRWTILPWQYYQAPFDVEESWNEVRLPWKTFKSSSTWLPNITSSRGLSSIGIVAFGREHTAQVAVKDIGFY